MEDGIKAGDETKMDCADGGAGPLSSGAAVSEEAAGDLADGNANKVAYKSDSSGNITGVSSAIPDVVTNGEAQNAPNRELDIGKMKDEQLEAIKQQQQEESLEEFIRDDELLVDDKDSCMVEKISVQPEAPKRKLQSCAIWVSNINPETKASSLKVELTKYGKVQNARIVTNGEKYYGYALLESAESAKLCIEQLNRKPMNGFEVQISFDPPTKRKSCEQAAKRTESREFSRHISKRRRRSASNDDPLTLKVSSSRKRSSEKRSRSSSKQRSRRGGSREFETNRQREIELRIAIEKRKLAKEKRQLEYEKLEFLKFQKRVQEYSVNDQVKKEVQRLEELRRAKDDEMLRKRILVEKTKRTPSPRSKSYKKRVDKTVPPPPRLTRDDFSSRRSWAKQKVENNLPRDYKYESTRKQDYRHNYQSDRKQRYVYPEAKRAEDKYKDKSKDSGKDATCKTMRSEVFVASSSSALAAAASTPCSNFQYGGGSVGVSYPTAYRGYNPQPPPPVEYHPPPQHIPVSHTQNNWNDRQQLYHKDYASSGSRSSVHVEHNKYDDYDKRQQPTYFNSNRKY
ncbi:PREDICTED: scaffold attachment factor B1-like [Nicrophorus vespilloides]|uniref:Scaffold attachment factor B1-like n=1 Tax=Nicrophorus vespilloides TaxID=110193 RepID=A0ABM1M141_NICVS|nr:PREDICTED: scaffold attachment factor B1-like [Nicrophorus vespilloides]